MSFMTPKSVAHSPVSTIRLFSATRYKEMDYMPVYQKGKKMQRLLAHFAKHDKLKKVTNIKLGLSNVTNKSLSSILNMLDSKTPNQSAQHLGILTPKGQTYKPLKTTEASKFEFSDYIPIPRSPESVDIKEKTIEEDRRAITVDNSCGRESIQMVINEYERKLTEKEDVITLLKEKIKNLEGYLEIHKQFKVQQVTQQIEGIKQQDKFEQEKIIENYENALNYLQFYNIETAQQKAFRNYLSETERLQNENNELRVKLTDFRKYMLSKAQVRILLGHQRPLIY